MSYAHSDEDISKLLKVYDEVFGVIKDVVREKSLDKKVANKTYWFLYLR